MKKEKEEIKTKTKKGCKNTFISLSSILSALVILYTLAIYRVEYLQMKELGDVYKNIFFINLKEKIGIMIVVFIATFLFIIAINKSLKKGFKTLFEKDKKELPELPNVSIAVLLSTINAVVAQFIFRGKILDLINIGWFGKTLDKIKFDYNFVMIISPIVQNILIYSAVVLLFGIVYAFIYFLAVVNTKLEGIDSKDLKTSSFVKIFRRLAITTLFIGLGIYIIRCFDLYSGDMFKKQSPDNTYLTGAGLADVTIKLWGSLILGLCFMFIIIRLNVNIKKEQGIKVIRNIITIPVLIVALHLLAIIFNLAYIRPNKLEKEQKYIEKNIKATEEAFGIKLNTKVIDEAKELTKEDIKNSEEILDKIPIISENMAEQNLETFKKKDSPYKYMAPNIISTNNSIEYFSPREVKETKKRTVDGKTYVYNHGIFGALTNALKTDEEGFLMLDEKFYEKPVLGETEIKQDRIYYGLNTYKTTVVGPNIDEFDYEVISKKTKEKEIIPYKYTGKGGINLNKKDAMLLSLFKLDFNILSEGGNKENKTLINRQIIDRAKAVLPQLIYDDEPYLLPNENGGLTWVLDAYTSTNKYPYSQKILTRDDKNGSVTRINYFKNSIKVLIDAYDGTVQFYIMDETDPYAKQIQNKYKKLFKTKADMPDIIKNNLLYPRKLYDIQAKAIETYHKVSADVLYRSEDIWEASSVKNGNNKKIEARYVKIKPEIGEEGVKNETQLVLLTMYTPLNKQNINAYLVGNTKDGNNNLTLYKFDQNESLLSLNFMKDKIHEDDKAKIELEKLNRMGTELVKDTMLIPIKTSILYVEPVYQIHLNENSVPVLKMVVVANGSKVGIGSNIKEAANNLFSDTAISIDIYNPDNFMFLIDAIISTNKNLKESMDSKNWNYVGKDINRMTKLVEQLERAKIKEEISKSKEKVEEQKHKKQKENAQLEETNVKPDIEENEENTNTENQGFFHKFFKTTK